MAKKLIIIFPCYNEEEVLPTTKKHILAKLDELIQEGIVSEQSKICFVDDGSIDGTWDVIKNSDHTSIVGVKLAANRGHQFALLAGLESFKNQFDIYITMDVDLQDDITSIKAMVLEHQQGFDVVYGVRNDRKTDTKFKMFSAQAFYKLMRRMGVETIHNHADYRLVSNRALLAFLEFKESHLYLRGMFPLVGFRQSKIFYKRQKRDFGESKYPLRKMLSFAWEGVTSFSDKPLKLVILAGVIALFVSVILVIYATVQLILGNVITGWTSMVILIIFFGGLQTFSLGIIGEYIGKIYMQAKQRPRYTVEEIKYPKNDKDYF